VPKREIEEGQSENWEQRDVGASENRSPKERDPGEEGEIGGGSGHHVITGERGHKRRTRSGRKKRSRGNIKSLEEEGGGLILKYQGPEDRFWYDPKRIKTNVSST